MISPIEELLAKGVDARSYSINQRATREVQFESLTDAQLREQAAFTGPGHYERWDRTMLLALLRNRYRCGYFIEVLEGP